MLEPLFETSLCMYMYRKFNTCKKSACMQTMGGGSIEGTEAIPIHQLHQRSELIMLSHMWTLSLTASLLFALLKFSG